MSTVGECRHFVLEPLADGVLACVHRAGGWAVGSAGIVDLGDLRPQVASAAWDFAFPFYLSNRRFLLRRLER